MANWSESQLLSYVAWAFLPKVVNWIQNFLYILFIRAGDPKPPPGSPRWIRHRKIIHSGVIVTYMLYSIYESDWELQRASDFYQALGVPVDASERIIQSRFRRLTVLHHPDKVTSEKARPAAEAYYVYLKLARDTLVDPAKRFAYDRFGPEILEWKQCVTIRDFIFHGAQRAVAPYVAGGAIMVVLGMLGYLQWGRYWRYLSTAAMVVFEAHTITRPEFPFMISKVINPLFAMFKLHPPLLPFQLRTIARRFIISLFIAMTQIAPVFSDPGREAQDTQKAQQQQLDRLSQITALADRDAQALLTLETMPFTSEDGKVDLRGKVKDWLVQNSIRSDRVVRDAMGNALRRRREGAPAGARGTT
ncbi:membrane associated DnaJ chaperone-like protein [Phyllosticta citriasiana]|uniref:Membrane associated DnaJ chaperone-like protein n=1 Tax=Phyllosticta citriasiana TaxID=595635 RepID=A0ABR1KBK6_9PEZI